MNGQKVPKKDLNIESGLNDLIQISLHFSFSFFCKMDVDLNNSVNSVGY